MSEPTCRWAGSTNPRTIPGRHIDECEGSCAGCQPCTEPHCRVCNHTHTTGTCAECLATTRANLRGIANLCGTLPAEVQHRGINGEAMTLLGPVADYEARGHIEASIAAGRIPPDYLDTADNDLHPLTILGTWDAIWRDALDHDEPTERLTIATAVNYIDTQLTYMSGYEHTPFEDTATDIRQCLHHLEAVLHAGEQVDRGAPCMTCRVPLERVWGPNKAADGWACPRCRQTSTEDQYRFAVMNLYREEATHLTDRDMELRTGVKAGTVRVWANRGEIGRVTDAGRVLYSVTDVQRRATKHRHDTHPG